MVQDASKGADTSAVVRNMPLLEGIGDFTVGLDPVKYRRELLRKQLTLNNLHIIRALFLNSIKNN